MKRIDLIRSIMDAGAQFVREGGEHTVYRNPRTNELISVPRHRELKEGLAKKLIKQARS